MDRSKVTQPRGDSDYCDVWYVEPLVVGSADVGSGEAKEVPSIWLKGSRDGKWVLRELKRPIGFRKR